MKAGARRRNTHPAVCIGAVLAIGLVAGGCRQVMMPTPVIYHDERFDPFFNTPEEERSTIIPVFYATDRQRLGEADEPRYTNAIDLPLSLGQAEVRLGDERMTWEELREASTGPDRRRSVPLYLLDLDEDGALSTTADRREFSDERDEPGRELTSGERAFIDKLNRQLAGSVNKDLTIYVHGFKVTFDNPCLVGDELVIRIPGSAQGGAATWRVTSFDSLMLRRTQTARRGTRSDGRPEWTVRFVARTPGNCEIILTRTLLGPDGKGEIGERRRYRVRMRNR